MRPPMTRKNEGRSCAQGDNIQEQADGRDGALCPKGRSLKDRLLYGCCYGRAYGAAAGKQE